MIQRIIFCVHLIFINIFLAICDGLGRSRVSTDGITLYCIYYFQESHHFYTKRTFIVMTRKEEKGKFRKERIERKKNKWTTKTEGRCNDIVTSSDRLINGI